MQVRLSSLFTVMESDPSFSEEAQSLPIRLQTSSRLLVIFLNSCFLQLLFKSFLYIKKKKRIISLASQMGLLTFYVFSKHNTHV